MFMSLYNWIVSGKASIREEEDLTINQVLFVNMLSFKVTADVHGGYVQIYTIINIFLYRVYQKRKPKIK